MAGPGLVVYHGFGLVVPKGSVLGSGCIMRQGVTISNKIGHTGLTFAALVIGKSIELGANAVLIGGVYVGDGAIIGAGAVVTKDVQAGAVVVAASVRYLAPR